MCRSSLLKVGKGVCFVSEGQPIALLGSDVITSRYHGRAAVCVR